MIVGWFRLLNAEAVGAVRARHEQSSRPLSATHGRKAVRAVPDLECTCNCPSGERMDRCFSRGIPGAQPVALLLRVRTGGCDLNMLNTDSDSESAVMLGYVSELSRCADTAKPHLNLRSDRKVGTFL